ncbi:MULTISPECIES: hypothetical protein [Clostridioides]|uniref:hypothetical protein n=1 Tax=Clostridioides sp. ZZV14-6387 TaxID=2811497 RepID=UPI0007BB0402|nr:hypothetical protein [Clostridioides sp. ZZV14-6387]CZR96021.1 hypothetical protein CDFC105_60810 [Clostridioides difficile]CZS06709.1 hypothetical protein CDFC105_72238 [Clostridioides difficile]
MNTIDYEDKQITTLWNEYANTRNSGLKKLANKKLDLMIEYILTLPEIKQKHFITYICKERFDNNNIKTFQQPLVVKLIFPIVKEAILNEEMPFLRWGYQLDIPISLNSKEYIYYSSENMLKDALKLDSKDIKSVELLLNKYIDELWFASHHIQESVILSTKANIKYDLDEMDKLLTKYEENLDSYSEYLKEKTYYQELYNLWFQYDETNKNISFPEWLEIRGYNYSWCNVFYYKK